MKTLDRVILAVIALALSVIAVNPWVAPGYVQAQGGVVQVDIVRVEGKTISNKLDDFGVLPVRVKGSVQILR